MYFISPGKLKVSNEISKCACTLWVSMSSCYCGILSTLVVTYNQYEYLWRGCHCNTMLTANIGCLLSTAVECVTVRLSMCSLVWTAVYLVPGFESGLECKIRSRESRHVYYRINILGSLLSSSNINLVPVQAGNVTVRVASHWPWWVTDNSGITTYVLNGLREMSTPPML